MSKSLQNYAAEGYEIHGERHKALLRKAEGRGVLIGCAATAIVGFIFDLIGLL